MILVSDSDQLATDIILLSDSTHCKYNAAFIFNLLYYKIVMRYCLQIRPIAHYDNASNSTRFTIICNTAF